MCGRGEAYSGSSANDLDRAFCASGLAYCSHKSCPCRRLGARRSRVRTAGTAVAAAARCALPGGRHECFRPHRLFTAGPTTPATGGARRFCSRGRPCLATGGPAASRVARGRGHSEPAGQGTGRSGSSPPGGTASAFQRDAGSRERYGAPAAAAGEGATGSRGPAMAQRARPWSAGHAGPGSRAGPGSANAEQPIADGPGLRTAVLDAVRLQGQLDAVPLVVTPTILWFDQTMFEAYGRAQPDSSWG